MQQEFSAALYQLMTRTRRKEENDVQSPKLDVMQENGNNAKLNTVVPDNHCCDFKLSKVKMKILFIFHRAIM